MQTIDSSQQPEPCTSAPASRSERTAGSLPTKEATNSGVRPSLSGMSTTARAAASILCDRVRGWWGRSPAACSISTWSTAKWFCAAARNSGVRSPASVAPMLAPAPSSDFTTPALPASAATCSGVRPQLSRVSTASPFASSARNSVSSPPLAAACNGVVILKVAEMRVLNKECLLMPAKRLGCGTLCLDTSGSLGSVSGL
mmetsp:Transcript_3292/g.11438  ORF Transcript_3292/g.11438 Transcript_3292/m.11438 type:complete len:200 (+) Transcript_3292:1003-1602(+)